MSAIFENESLGPTERLIMLALADHADDSGRCYPSIQRLCQRTGLGERAVQINIRKLVDAGYLSILMGGGKSNSNVYFVSANPAVNAPYAAEKQTPHEMHPAPDAHQTPHFVRSNPAPDAPEPSGTINEPSVVRVKATDAVLSLLCEVHGVSTEAAQSFIAYRRKHKAKALTETAAKRLAGNLWNLVDQGGDPNDALGMAEEKGWASVEPHWYFNAKGQAHDNRTQGNVGTRNSRPGSGTAAAFAAVAARYSGRTQ